ncbi:MAG: polysulfide reductase NrfD [Sandaracinaceae bacterium]|nr:polysulfide reductase NrfD [Sandaracinaceae bacterium]
MSFIRFVLDCVRQLLRGDRLYWGWVLVLAVISLQGLLAYVEQYQYGLITTGMHDHVPWGTYIANFGFLDGIAASSSLLLIAAFVFDRSFAKRVAMLGAGVAISASIACMLFVVVDLGRPERAWHLIPHLGSLNWPRSMLSWDVVALNGYLVINILVPTYALYRTWQGRSLTTNQLFPAALLAIAWAILVQSIIAFLFSANVGRPFWHTALLGPRFLASSFTAGSCLMILAFRWIDRHTEFRIDGRLVRYLALLAAVALQINLFMVGNELFVSLYHPSEHSRSVEYLFFGHEGLHGLVPWIYTSMAMQATACVILMIEPARNHIAWLTAACVLAIVGIWIDKGMGLIVPGFIPDARGAYVEYQPTFSEARISLAVWAFGLLIFTGLAKASIPIETGQVRKPGVPLPDPALARVSVPDAA